MKEMVVYRFTFPNGYYYFGYTDNIERRWASHGNLYKRSVAYDFIQKYGWENIRKEILYRTEPSPQNRVLCEKIETELIKMFDDKCFNIKTDYNDCASMASLRNSSYIERFPNVVSDLKQGVISLTDAMNVCNLSLGKFLDIYGRFYGSPTEILS